MPIYYGRDATQLIAEFSGPVVVLLADDGPATQTLALLMRDWEFSPLVGDAVSAVLPVAQAPEVNVVAVVADFEITREEDGVAAAAALAEAIGEAVPSIIMTSSFGLSVERKTRSLETIILTKPFEPEELYEQLTFIVSRNENS